jgi:20S proteasome alpha/beta subunit
MWDDGNSLGPKEIHSYLTRVMYNRRNKFDPLWNSLVLGGVKKGPKGEEKYLGTVYSSFKQQYLILDWCQFARILCLLYYLFRLT